LLEDHLNELVAAKQIRIEDAIAKANSPELIRRPGVPGGRPVETPV
jgi:hypothetical protein